MVLLQHAGVEFTITRSKKLLFTISALHLLALAACWMNALPFLYSALCALLALLSWNYQYKFYLTNNPISLRYTDNAGWTILLANQRNYCPVKLLSTSVAGNLLIVLHLCVENVNQYLVIFDDALPVGAYRRLQILLKTSGCNQG
ncbi:MAG: protein YgfX [Methylomonas sp.]|jgi:hypothetical protein